MSVFIAEHEHAEKSCPAKNPRLAAGLLQVVPPANAKAAGVTIRGEAVASGKHHLYLIVEAATPEAVRTYLAPFGQVGSLTVTPASHCEEVVRRGFC